MEKNSLARKFIAGAFAAAAGAALIAASTSAAAASTPGPASDTPSAWCLTSRCPRKRIGASRRNARERGGSAGLDPDALADVG